MPEPLSEARLVEIEHMVSLDPVAYGVEGELVAEVRRLRWLIDSTELTSREREVFRLRDEGLTWTDIAKRLGISRERVRMLHNAAGRKIRLFRTDPDVTVTVGNLSDTALAAYLDGIRLT